MWCCVASYIHVLMLLFPHDCNLKGSWKDLSSLVYAALLGMELLLFQYLHD